MPDYRLLIFNENGQVLGPAKAIVAANDAEAVAQADAIRGSLAAELLDFESLRTQRALGRRPLTGERKWAIDMCPASLGF